MGFSVTLFLFPLCHPQHVGCPSWGPKMTPEDLYIIYLVNKLQIHKIIVSFLCWGNFPGPRWSHSLPGNHVDKPRLREFLCLCKWFTWPEMWYIQSANPQTLSQLWALSLFPVPSDPKQGRLCDPSQSDILYFSLPSSFYKSLLLSTPFCNSLNGDCSLREVLSKVGLYL